MQPLSATMPVMVCPGNHELEPLFTAYNARFASMPGATPQWYSWEEGPVHMIQLNSFGDCAFNAHHAAPARRRCARNCNPNETPNPLPPRP
jgi:hypothetical protein